MNARRVRLGAIGLVLLLAACVAQSGLPQQSPAYGPIGDEADAIEAARLLTWLRPPIQVTGSARHGRARDLYDGAYSSFGSEADAAAYQARLERIAWRVDVVGLAPPNNCGNCAPVLWSEELVIDEQTGILLFSVGSEGPR